MLTYICRLQIRQFLLISAFESTTKHPNKNSTHRFRGQHPEIKSIFKMIFKIYFINLSSHREWDIERNSSCKKALYTNKY